MMYAFGTSPWLSCGTPQSRRDHCIAFFNADLGELAAHEHNLLVKNCFPRSFSEKDEGSRIGILFAVFP